MATSIREKADMLVELIHNTDRKMSHGRLEPADLRHKLERIASGAFTPEDAHYHLGWASGVCLSFGWVENKDLEEIHNGTYRRKAKPRPTAPDTSRKQLGSTDDAPKVHRETTGGSGSGDEG